jgi:hypothetical protein
MEREERRQIFGIEGEQRPNGAAAAAILAASVGVFVIGLLTTLGESIHSIGNWLNWYNPTGSLSGKTTMGVIVWLVVWVGAHYLLRRQEVNLTRPVQIAALLLIVGLVLMFPLVFQAFE